MKYYIVRNKFTIVKSCNSWFEAVINLWRYSKCRIISQEELRRQLKDHLKSLDEFDKIYENNKRF